MNLNSVRIIEEPSWSRRNSIESVLSIQGKETDFVRDTTDIESLSDRNVEFEPCSEPESEPPNLGDSSGESDNEIIATKVIEVSVGDDGDLEFADSEQTATDGSDSELDLCDFWRCAQCDARNNNPFYRYCESCFKVRKNFFPPRPKRKHKRKLLEQEQLRPLSQDSGIESQDLNEPQPSCSQQGRQVPARPPRKRRAESADRESKRTKIHDSGTASSSESTHDEIKPPVKTLSDPSVAVEDVEVNKKQISEGIKEKLEKDRKDNNLCITCLTEPKSGVFVHGRIAHICCCYKCAVKVWAKAKRCPVCNCKVSNVLKAVVM